MRLHNRKGLRTLMVVRDVSQRRLALAAGYRSHTYLGRLLRGEAESLEPGAAVRIARFLQVDLEFLFAPGLPHDDPQSAHRHSSPGGSAMHTRRRERQ
jgi:transcriptional regulator with XRE-family HTH domain